MTWSRISGRRFRPSGSSRSIRAASASRSRLLNRWPIVPPRWSAARFVQQRVSKGDIGPALLAVGLALGILGERKLVPQVFLGQFGWLEIQPGSVPFVRQIVTLGTEGVCCEGRGHGQNHGESRGEGIERCQPGVASAPAPEPFITG